MTETFKRQLIYKCYKLQWIASQAHKYRREVATCRRNMIINLWERNTCKKPEYEVLIDKELMDCKSPVNKWTTTSFKSSHKANKKFLKSIKLT